MTPQFDPQTPAVENHQVTIGELITLGLTTGNGPAGMADLHAKWLEHTAKFEALNRVFRARAGALYGPMIKGRLDQSASPAPRPAEATPAVPRRPVPARTQAVPAAPASAPAPAPAPATPTTRAVPNWRLGKGNGKGHGKGHGLMIRPLTLRLFATLHESYRTSPTGDSGVLTRDDAYHLIYGRKPVDNQAHILTSDARALARYGWVVEEKDEAGRVTFRLNPAAGREIPYADLGPQAAILTRLIRLNREMTVDVLYRAVRRAANRAPWIGVFTPQTLVWNLKERSLAALVDTRMDGATRLVKLKVGVLDCPLPVARAADEPVQQPVTV